MTRRWRLFPKYAILIMALVGGTLIASSAMGLYFSYRENQDHLAALQAEKAQGAANRIDVRRELRLLGDDDDVHIGHAVAGGSHHRRCLSQHGDAVGGLPRRIGIREMPSDVARADRTKHRIGHGVTDRVAVGVCLEPFVERDGHAA